MSPSRFPSPELAEATFERRYAGTSAAERVSQLEEQLQAEREARARAEGQLAAYEKLVPILNRLIQSLPRHPSQGDPPPPGLVQWIGSLQQQRENLDLPQDAAASGGSTAAGGSPGSRPESQRRRDARRLHRGGWVHIGQNRWRSPEGIIAPSRGDALKALSGIQLSLPVLVEVVAPPTPRPTEAAMHTSPESLTSVHELAALWDEVLKGVRPAWGTVLSAQQAALERIARKDERLRTREEWRRILWRVRSSPILLGQVPMSNGTYITMRPTLLLNDGRGRGVETFATRAEGGQYDPDPTASTVRVDGIATKTRQHVDAQGLPWWEGRCQTGCCQLGCNLEGTNGFRRGEQGPMNPAGALCEAHSAEFDAWSAEVDAGRPESPEQLEQLIQEWNQNQRPSAGQEASDAGQPSGQLRASGS